MAGIKTVQERVTDMLKDMSIDELTYVIARYTGPGNKLLSIKKFGIVLTREQVEEVALEKTLLGQDSVN